MDSKQCPKCGVANPPSRATCQACHTMLGGPINLNPLESAPPPSLPKHVAKKKVAPKKKIKESITVKKKLISRKIERTKIEGTRMFLLDGYKLRTVIVSTSVRKSKPTSEEKRLISLWNRNKSLIK